jgi:transcriptional regulator with XRE-family HTH domain
MGTLYENIMALCAAKGIKGGKMCTDIGISKGLLTDLKMGRRTGVSAVTAQKIANYFNVSVGCLLGEEETERAPTKSGERSISDDDIKFALFGGDGEITDAMYQEVKEFAALIKLREDMRKSKE